MLRVYIYMQAMHARTWVRCDRGGENVLHNYAEQEEAVSKVLEGFLRDVFTGIICFIILITMILR